MTHLDQHLSHLESSGLIAIAKLLPDLEYLFRHALVQDAAYASLLRKDRRDLHLAVGQALESAYPDRLDELSARLAVHFAEAGDDDRALTYYRRAGDHAYAQYALAEAIAHYGAAMDLITARGLASDAAIAIHIATSKGRALELQGEYERALATYEALEAAGDHLENATMRLAGLVAQCLVRSVTSTVFDVEKSVVLAERAHALSRELGDRAAESRILWTQGIAQANSTLNMALAHDYFARALDLARELGMDEHRAFILTDMAHNFYIMESMHAAATALEEAIPIWRALNNVPMLAYALNQLMETQFLEGRLSDAEATGLEANTIALAIGNQGGIGFSNGILAQIAWYGGNIGHALDRMLAAEIASQHSPMLILAQTGLAVVCASAGNCDRFYELSKQILSPEDRTPLSSFVELNVLVSLALAETYCGEPGQVIKRLEQMIAAAQSTPSHVDTMLLVGVVLGIQAAHAGDYGEALRLYDATLEAYDRSGKKLSRPEALLFKAHALIQLDRDVEALAVLRGAADEARAMTCRLFLWRILSALATLTERMNLPDEATRHRVEGRDVLGYIAASLEDRYPDLRASLLDLPEAAVLREGSRATL